MATQPIRFGRFSAVFIMSALLSPLLAAPVFIGTNTNAIQAADFDPASGRFGPVRAAAALSRASFLARSTDGRFLYSVADNEGGTLHAFAVAADGGLTALNNRTSGGKGPCDIALSPDGKLVAAANYSGGSVIVYSVEADGSLGAQAAFFQHTYASKAHADRQGAAHAHGTTWSPDGRLLLVPDLGGDRVYLYARDAATGRLAPNPAQAWLEMAPAAGPRHAQFSSDGRHLYIINELDNTLAVAAYDDAGTLKLIDAVSTLPAGGFAGKTTTAEVAVHPNGRTVYGSNRGHDTLAVFARDTATGRLTLTAAVPVPAHPRHFSLSPDARWLLVAGRDADRVDVFAVDAETGALSPTGESLATPKPVCVRF
jgi:6-phosphogluconolactonase